MALGENSRYNFKILNVLNVPVKPGVVASTKKHFFFSLNKINKNNNLNVLNRNSLHVVCSELNCLQSVLLTNNEIIGKTK